MSEARSEELGSERSKQSRGRNRGRPESVLSAPTRSLRRYNPAGRLLRRRPGTCVARLRTRSSDLGRCPSAGSFAYGDNRRTVATHVATIAGIAGILAFLTVYPFLPGRYDRLAVPLSTTVQVSEWSGLRWFL